MRMLLNWVLRTNDSPVSILWSSSKPSRGIKVFFEGTCFCPSSFGGILAIEPPIVALGQFY